MTPKTLVIAADWYFFGRLVGNSGPGRTLSRESRTQRIAAAFDRDLGKSARLDLAASYSRATGNINFPAEYHYRKFLAFRGFGGPDCGVGVVADATAPAGMAIADHDKVAGTGDCRYYTIQQRPAVRAAAGCSVRERGQFRLRPRPRKQPRTTRLDQRGSQSGQHRYLGSRRCHPDRYLD